MRATIGVLCLALLLGCGLAKQASAKAPSSVSFSPLSATPLSQWGYPVVLADVNGDGVLDDAMPQASGILTTLLGDGRGGFAAPSSAPTSCPCQPQYEAQTAGDFNGDGHIDVAAASYANSTVAIMLGGGTGSFTEASFSPVAVGACPYAIESGDINGDGHLDLAVGSVCPPVSVAVLLGDGTGRFSPAPGSPRQSATLLGVGDIDGDRRADVVVVDPPDVVRVLSDATGTLVAKTIGPYADGPGVARAQAIVGDVNGDRRADVVLFDTKSACGEADGCGPVMTLVNRGRGGFRPVVSPLATTDDLEQTSLADLNGDGRPDLVVTGDGGIGIMLGEGDGAFDATGSQSDFSPWPGEVDSAAVSDVNGDGRQDIVAVGRAGDAGEIRTLVNHPGPAPRFDASAGCGPTARITVVVKGIVLASIRFTVDGHLRAFDPFPSSTLKAYRSARGLAAGQHTVRAYIHYRTGDPGRVFTRRVRIC
jgi:FG-GAP-like repeat